MPDSYFIDYGQKILVARFLHFFRNLILHHCGGCAAARGIAGEGNDEEYVDGSTMSMIVVDVCRRTGGFELGKHMNIPRVIQVENIYRASTRTVTIDEALEKENLMPSDDEDEEEGA